MKYHNEKLLKTTLFQNNLEKMIFIIVQFILIKNKNLIFEPFFGVKLVLATISFA